MKMNIENMAPSCHVSELDMAIPAGAFTRIRAYHQNVSIGIVIEGLEMLGSEVVCDAISQGFNLHDVAFALKLPITILDNWLSDNHLEDYRHARRLSAEAKVSMAKTLLMDVKKGDRDGMATAKIQADHLKWEAARDDPAAYGDRSAKYLDGATVMFNINLSPASSKSNSQVIEVQSF